MDTCKYCHRKLKEGEPVSWEDTQPVCLDCGVSPSDNGPIPVETAETPPWADSGENIPDALKEILSATQAPFLKELAFTRVKQAMNGETDAVLLKRSLLEILTIMGLYVDNAKNESLVLDPQSALKGRFGLLNALAIGLGYLAMHPNPIDE